MAGSPVVRFSNARGAIFVFADDIPSALRWLHDYGVAAKYMEYTVSMKLLYWLELPDITVPVPDGHHDTRTLRDIMQPGGDAYCVYINHDANEWHVYDDFGDELGL